MGRRPNLRVPFIALVIFVSTALRVSWPPEPWFEKRRILETCLLGSVSRRKSRFLTGPDMYILKCFFANYIVITDMVLGQCFHIIVRF